MAQGQFEAEAEAYRRHLEEVYALCSPCDVQVRRTLLMQDSLLRPHLVGHPALSRWQVLARYSLVSGAPFLSPLAVEGWPSADPAGAVHLRFDE